MSPRIIHAAQCPLGTGFVNAATSENLADARPDGIIVIMTHMVYQKANLIVVRHVSIIQTIPDNEKARRDSFLRQYGRYDIIDFAKAVVESQQKRVIWQRLVTSQTGSELM